MESRIRNLQRMLRDPEIVEGPAESEVVAAGMFVTLRPPRGGRARGRGLPARGVGRGARPGVRTITTTSPLGKALLGANLEDRIAYEAPWRAPSITWS